MGHDIKIPKIPNPDIYKIENSWQLRSVQKYLADRGLKNPWLRNEVWRYHDLKVSRRSEVIRNLTTGLRVGVPLFLITIAIEKYYGIDYGYHKPVTGRYYY